MTSAIKRPPVPGKTTTPPVTVRVAVYTRQSVADDKEFGSIKAQRETVEAYIKSQPGWVALETQYNDSGFSGGTTQRPAFQRLLEDIKSGGIDIVACYKLDRLSRSINDFVRITDLFQKRRVRFVSTTQAFDSSTSVGRMTVNLLATFATFEREMISERTKDKVMATRRKGFWAGGHVPLGYKLKEKRLVIHEEEAERVRLIFRLYVQFGSILAVTREADKRGWLTRNTNGRGGRPFDTQSARRILSNTVYVGKVKCGNEVAAGQHEAIIEQETWDSAQHQLQSNGKCRGPRNQGKSPALLRGLLRCGVCGDSMTTHSSRSGNRQYQFYVCRRYQTQGAASCPGSRAPVADLEDFVLSQIWKIGRDTRLVTKTIRATQRQFKVRKPELTAELSRLAKEKRRLEKVRENLLDAIAQAGNGNQAVIGRLGEAEVEVHKIVEKTETVQAELASLEARVIDEGDLRKALKSFDPVWDQLFPKERTRVLQLLLEEVTYNAEEGEVEIRFRPSGVRALAGENETKEAG